MNSRGHGPADFHAVRGDCEISAEIETGKVYGTVPPRVLNHVEERASCIRPNSPKRGRLHCSRPEPSPRERSLHRRRLRPAYQSPGQRPGRCAFAPDHGAADDRCRVAVRALHQAPAARWKVMRDFRRVQ